MGEEIPQFVAFGDNWFLLQVPYQTFLHVTTILNGGKRVLIHPLRDNKRDGQSILLREWIESGLKDGSSRSTASQIFEVRLPHARIVVIEAVLLIPIQKSDVHLFVNFI